MFGKSQQSFRRLLKIDHHTFLAAIDRVEVRTHAIRKWKGKITQIVAAFRILDLYDAGSHLTQKMRGIAARQQSGEIENDQSHRFCVMNSLRRSKAGTRTASEAAKHNRM